MFSSAVYVVQSDMSTDPPWSTFFFEGGRVQLSLSTAQRCLLHKNIIFFKLRKLSGVLLKMSLIFKKFCNIMKYVIKIIFIGVSGLCKNFLDQSCNDLDAEHRCVWLRDMTIIK